MSDPILTVMQKQLELSDNAVENLRERLYVYEKEISLLKKEKAALLEAVNNLECICVDDITCAICDMEKALEKLKEAREYQAEKERG